MSAGLFFGLTTVDLVCGVNRHPGPNEKMKAEWQYAFAGGPAANAAVAYAAFGNDSRLCSGLGTHPVARLAAADLSEHRVVLYDRAEPADALPVLSSILVNSSTGDRSVVSANTAGRRLRADDDDASLLDNTSTLLLDGHFLEQAIPLARMARERGVTVVLDGGSWKDGLEQLLPLVDYAICSAGFRPPGCRTAAEVGTYLTACRVTACAISRGERPVLVWTGAASRRLPVPAVRAVDTLGAGDILHGAFCHFINRAPFEHSLAQAIAVASESCRFIGTRQWIDHLPLP